MPYARSPRRKARRKLIRMRAGLLALLLAGGTAAVASGTAGASAQGDQASRHRACAAQFDAALREHLDAQNDRDPDRVARTLHDGYTIVFKDGEVVPGKAAGMKFFRDFLSTPGWQQTFKETRRVVSGCSTGFVLFDSVYTEPATNYRSHFIVGLSFTREHGRWLVLHDQNSPLPS